MNETIQPKIASDPEQSPDSERTKQVTVAGWTAGVSAIAALGTLEFQPSWPVAFGVAAIAAMVGAVCFCMLRR
jgi:hypothetical protein